MNCTKKGSFGRILAALCASCILFVCFAAGTAVSAQTATGLTASSVSAERGNTVSVTVALNGNPGLWGMKLKIAYDASALTLSSVANGTVFAEDDVTMPQTLNKEPFVYLASSNELKDITANGTVVTLKFKVSSGAAFSTYPITVSLTQAINVAGKEVPMAIRNGSVAVVKCIHSKVWQTTKDAGCEIEGMETEVCSKCKETFSTRPIKATGHQNTEVKNKVAATRTAEGYTGDTYCKDCGLLLSKGSAIAKLSSEEETSDGDDTDKEPGTAKGPGNNAVILAVVLIAVLCAGGSAAFIIIKRRRK